MHSRGAAQGKGCRDSEAGFEQRAARVTRFQIMAVRHVDLQRRTKLLQRRANYHSKSFA
jgi:hypothetical protein